MLKEAGPSAEELYGGCLSRPLLAQALFDIMNPSWLNVGGPVRVLSAIES